MMDIKVSVEDFGMGLRVVIGSGVNEYLLVPDDALALAERIIAHTRAALVNVDKARPGTLERTQLRIAEEELRRTIDSMEERMAKAERIARSKPPPALATVQSTMDIGANVV